MCPVESYDQTGGFYDPAHWQEQLRMERILKAVQTVRPDAYPTAMEVWREPTEEEKKIPGVFRNSYVIGFRTPLDYYYASNFIAANNDTHFKLTVISAPKINMMCALKDELHTMMEREPITTKKAPYQGLASRN